MAVAGVAGSATAQGGAPIPKFEDYPVRDVFRQTPHAPVLTTPEQRRFRTRIRQGVEKGWGAYVNGYPGSEPNRPGPNFAGRYVVIGWGCGVSCIQMAMTDAVTGTVYELPLSEGGFTLPMLVMSPVSPGSNPEVEYRRDSRLMIIRATPNAYRAGSAAYEFYYLWTGESWKLLRKYRLEE